jgi:hypothetical protein
MITTSGRAESLVMHKTRPQRCKNAGKMWGERDWSNISIGPRKWTRPKRAVKKDETWTVAAKQFVHGLDVVVVDRSALR